MLQGLLGKKIGMSRLFGEKGESIPVTLISCGPCYVVESAGGRVKLGYDIIKEKSLNKPQLEYLKKKNLPPLRHLKEVHWLGAEKEMPAVGQKICVDIFQAGQMINIQGVSKGKGHTGVVKRWGFKGAHGHGSKLGRLPGSIGQAASPSRVFPGMKMAGRKGGANITVRNLQVVSVDAEENIIAVKGAVPGPNKSLVFIQGRDTGKKIKNYES